MEELQLLFKQLHTKHFSPVLEILFDDDDTTAEVKMDLIRHY
jgi:hypothetical protein